MPSEIEVIRAALKESPEMAARLRRMALEGKIKPMAEADKDEVLTVVATGNHYGIIGCVQTRCACGERVWLSPSTQAMLKERGATPTRIVCSLCFLSELESQREERPNA